MIDEIAIHGIGVIEEAVLRPAPGFTVLTGETGAGKTMVVTALELLLGARGDAGLVRQGVDAARVEARLRPVPSAAVAAGLADEDADELVVERELVPGDDGLRSRVRVGGRMATVATLAEVLGPYVEVHAQGSHARLVRPAVQRGLLDRYAGDDHLAALGAYRGAYREWQEALDHRAALASGARERAREIEVLRHEIAEIDRVAPDAAADAGLDAEIARLEHTEELATAAASAAEVLGEDGAAGPVGEVVALLRRAAGLDPGLGDALARAESLAVETADLRATLRGYAEGLEADPVRLEELRTRRRAIADLERRFGPGVEGVLAYRTEAEGRLARLDGEEFDVAAMDERIDGLGARVAELAGEVGDGRRTAAVRLTEAVVGHLSDLGMPHAEFRVELREAGEPGPEGAESVAFALSANPGEPPRGIADAVSGGERSRVALAVEVALADLDEALVLVFDEVDAGVGGATALAVGEKLARLAHGAEGRQVVCVTHLAQIAAFADSHHVVVKTVIDGRTRTEVREVDADERPAEIARMLSGAEDRAAGLAHARELLADAAARRG